MSSTIEPSLGETVVSFGLFAAVLATVAGVIAAIAVGIVRRRSG